MARYTGPDCKRCRREKMKLFLKGASASRRSARSRSVPTRRVSTAAVAPRRASTSCRCARSRSARASTACSRSSSAATTTRPTASRARPARTCCASSRRRLDNVVYRAGFAKSRDMARQLVRHGHITVNGQQGRHPVLPRERERHRRGPRQSSLELTPFVVARAEVGERDGAGVDRGHPEQDADPRALPPGPAGHRHAGPGAADRRALLEVALDRPAA